MLLCLRASVPVDRGTRMAGVIREARLQAQPSASVSTMQAKNAPSAECQSRGLPQLADGLGVAVLRTLMGKAKALVPVEFLSGRWMCLTFVSKKNKGRNGIYAPATRGVGDFTPGVRATGSVADSRFPRVYQKLGVIPCLILAHSARHSDKVAPSAIRIAGG